MQLYPALLGLPAPLLLLIAAQVDGQLPTAVRKMGLDDGEKFFPEYMAFEEEIYEQAMLSPREAVAAVRMSREEEVRLLGTDSLISYQPPFAPHVTGDEGQLGWEIFRRAGEALSLLQGRQSCPEGMGNCANVGEPNKCCMNTEVCVTVQDSSSGNIACCPQGKKCSGAVGQCAQGATSCPAELGGGCCIPGFVCLGVGCKLDIPSQSIS